MAFCSSLQLEVAGSLHGHADVCARFLLPVRGERYLDGFVAHIPSSGIVSLRKNLGRIRPQDHVPGTPSG